MKSCCVALFVALTLTRVLSLLHLLLLTNSGWILCEAAFEMLDIVVVLHLLVVVLCHFQVKQEPIL